MVWRLLDELEGLRSEMKRLMNIAPKPAGGTRKDAVPLLNVRELPREYLIESEIPGADRSKFEVTLTSGTLAIRGAYAKPDKTGTWVRRERPVGAFLRTLDLPKHLDPEKVDAEYKDGVFTVRIAKSAEAQPRRIEVKAG